MARIKRTRQHNAPGSPIPNKIGERREAMGMKQEEMAKELETNRGTLSVIESGYMLPSKDMARKLCKFFKCEIGDLYPPGVLEFIA